MKRYLLILRMFLKVRFIFKNPRKYDLVIFDNESMMDFQNFISDYDFFVLEARIEKIYKIYCTFKLLKYFFKYYKGSIVTAYLLSLIEIVSPKVILTNIDHSFKFSDLAKVLDNKINFVAVQNAVRYNLKQFEHLYKKNINKSNFNERFYIPNFLCFGQFEIDDFKRYKIKIKNFFKIGSLRLANFFYYINKNKIKLKKNSYDICLISEPAIGRDRYYGESNIEKGAADTVKFTIKFCMKHNMKLVFACKRDKKTNPKSFNIEMNFHKKYLTDNEFNYLLNNSLEKNKDGYSSYIAMLESKVVVARASTMLREYLAIGGKILSCNLTSTNIWDFPIQGICALKNCTYEEFEDRLLQIYLMSEKDYFSKLNKSNHYAVEYNKEVSTIEKLKEKIDSFITL